MNDLLALDWDVVTLGEAIAGGIVDGIAIGFLIVVLTLFYGRMRS